MTHRGRLFLRVPREPSGNAVDYPAITSGYTRGAWINPPAMELLGYPEYVELWQADSMYRIQPSAPDEPDARRLKSIPGQRGRALSCMSLHRAIKGSYSGPVRVHAVDGGIEFDLDPFNTVSDGVEEAR